MNINKMSPKTPLHDTNHPSGGRNTASAKSGASGAQAPPQRDPKMLEAARAFEGQFVRQLISEMRKTVPDDPLVPETMADKIFREQLDNQYADMWVGQGGVGLADMVYENLMEKYGPDKGPSAHGKGHVYPVQQKQGSLPVPGEAYADQPQEILNRDDRDRFLIKKSPEGFSLKAKSALTSPVGLRSPLPGLVLQAAALDDGKNMVVVKHDQGLISRLVHSGNNHVKTGARIGAGDVLATLPASNDGRVANVFFGLRKAAKVE